nr:MAG TPA: hypothetical protein [Caudoviricetes sp.]
MSKQRQKHHSTVVLQQFAKLVWDSNPYGYLLFKSRRSASQLNKKRWK